MQLRNQNNQNLNSQISNFAEQLKKDGKDPKTIVMQMLKEGKISQADLEKAKNFAISAMRK